MTTDQRDEALRIPQASPQERCKHGVWAADHCYQCAAPQEPVAWMVVAPWGNSVSFEKPDFGRAEWKAPAPQTIALYAAPQPQAPGATSDDVRDRRIAELEEHLTQAIMGRQFHYERAEKAEAALADAAIQRDKADATRNAD
jgi:hypothetical protein